MLIKYSHRIISFTTNCILIHQALYRYLSRLQLIWIPVVPCSQVPVSVWSPVPPLWRLLSWRRPHALALGHSAHRHPRHHRLPRTRPTSSQYRDQGRCGSRCRLGPIRGPGQSGSPGQSGGTRAEWGDQGRVGAPRQNTCVVAPLLGPFQTPNIYSFCENPE